MIRLDINENELSNLEAEKALLGALLFSQERYSEVKNLVHRWDFTDERNEEAFMLIEECYLSGVNPIDYDTGKLYEAFEHELVACDAAYIDELLNGVYMSTNVVLYAWIVAEKGLLRKICIEKGVKL